MLFVLERYLVMTIIQMKLKLILIIVFYAMTVLRNNIKKKMELRQQIFVNVN